jgi:hypothetical protein
MAGRKKIKGKNSFFFILLFFLLEKGSLSKGKRKKEMSRPPKITGKAAVWLVMYCVDKNNNEVGATGIPTSIWLEMVEETDVRLKTKILDEDKKKVNIYVPRYDGSSLVIQRINVAWIFAVHALTNKFNGLKLKAQDNVNKIALYDNRPLTPYNKNELREILKRFNFARIGESVDNLKFFCLLDENLDPSQQWAIATNTSTKKERLVHREDIGIAYCDHEFSDDYLRRSLMAKKETETTLCPLCKEEKE